MIKNRKYAKGGLNKMKQRVAIITGADGGMVIALDAQDLAGKAHDEADLAG